MTQEVAQIITLFLTAIAAIGALWAAGEARRSARASKDIGEAQLLVHFLDQYASDEMLKSFRTLRNWEKSHTAEFAKIWKKPRDEGAEEALELDKDRRRVLHYYLKARLLYERHYVSDRFVKAITRAGLGILHEIVEPLEYAVDCESKDLGTAEYLRKVSGEKEFPFLRPPVPVTSKPSEPSIGEKKVEGGDRKNKDGQ